MQSLPLFKDEYLFSHWEDEFQEFKQDGDAELLNVLRDWDARDKNLTESQLDGLFVTRVFHGIWGYWGPGTKGPSNGYTLLPERDLPANGTLCMIEPTSTAQRELVTRKFTSLGLKEVY